MAHHFIAGSFQLCECLLARIFFNHVGRSGMSHWVQVTLNYHKLKNNNFHYIGAYVFTMCVLLLKCVFISDSRYEKKITFIGSTKLISLRCIRDLTSASIDGRGWYKNVWVKSTVNKAQQSGTNTRMCVIHLTYCIWIFSCMISGLLILPDLLLHVHSMP